MNNIQSNTSITESNTSITESNTSITKNNTSINNESNTSINNESNTSITKNIKSNNSIIKRNISSKNFFCISSRVENTGQFYGCFKIGPFYESQSLTFANSLRRTLLTHQSKCIFNVVQIYGIEHEFSSLLGVRESIVDIFLNLEKLTLQTTKPLTKPKIAFVNFCGPGILQGKHIHLPSNFKCINPLQYIATLEIDGQLMFKLFFPPTYEYVSLKNFSEKLEKKQWSNLIKTNYYCLNIFSQKFLKN